MRKFLRRLLIALVAIVALWIGVALVLVVMPAPTFSKPPVMLPPGRIHRATECHDSAAERCFRMRDGVVLSARRYDAPGATTNVLLLHGVSSAASELDQTATALRDATNASVLALDLRGHGNSGGRSGDVDYIGQYEDDMADVVGAIRANDPKTRLILGGHSMGGGIAMSYAARPTMPPVDGYLLFAPLLGITSPTMRTETPSSSRPGDEPLAKFE